MITSNNLINTIQKNQLKKISSSVLVILPPNILIHETVVQKHPLLSCWTLLSCNPPRLVIFLRTTSTVWLDPPELVFAYLVSIRRLALLLGQGVVFVHRFGTQRYPLLAGLRPAFDALLHR